MLVVKQMDMHPGVDLRFTRTSQLDLASVRK